MMQKMPHAHHYPVAWQPYLCCCGECEEEVEQQGQVDSGCGRTLLFISIFVNHIHLYTLESLWQCIDRLIFFHYVTELTCYKLLCLLMDQDDGKWRWAEKVPWISHQQVPCLKSEGEESSSERKWAADWLYALYRRRTLPGVEGGKCWPTIKQTDILRHVPLCCQLQ